MLSQGQFPNKGERVANPLDTSCLCSMYFGIPLIEQLALALINTVARYDSFQIVIRILINKYSKKNTHKTP